MRTRLLIGLLGVAATAYGAWLLAEDLPDLVDTAVWLAAGVVLHDFVLVPLTLTAGWIATRLLRPRLRAPVAAGLVVLGTLTLVAVPVLGGWGANADNPTILDRDYRADWGVVAAGIVVTSMLVNHRAHREVEAAIAVLRRQGAAGRPEAAVAADRCEALLMAARGDVDNALTVLVRVVDQAGSECPFEAARSRLALGQVYRRAGYKGMASEALNAAAGSFEKLGVLRWADRARDEADRVGLHPRGSTLTETERRVAELVGAGRSNHETAAELFMSVKTVEANLTRIYRKLGVRSRTQLARQLGAE